MVPLIPNCPKSMPAFNFATAKEGIWNGKVPSPRLPAATPSRFEVEVVRYDSSHRTYQLEFFPNFWLHSARALAVQRGDWGNVLPVRSTGTP